MAVDALKYIRMSKELIQKYPERALSINKAFEGAMRGDIGALSFLDNLYGSVAVPENMRPLSNPMEEIARARVAIPPVYTPVQEMPVPAPGPGLPQVGIGALAPSPISPAITDPMINAAPRRRPVLMAAAPVPVAPVPVPGAAPSYELGQAQAPVPAALKTRAERDLIAEAMQNVGQSQVNPMGLPLAVAGFKMAASQRPGIPGIAEGALGGIDAYLQLKQAERAEQERAVKAAIDLEGVKDSKERTKLTRKQVEGAERIADEKLQFEKEKLKIEADLKKIDFANDALKVKAYAAMQMADPAQVRAYKFLLEQDGVTPKEAMAAVFNISELKPENIHRLRAETFVKLMAPGTLDEGTARRLVEELHPLPGGTSLQKSDTITVGKDGTIQGIPQKAR